MKRSINQQQGQSIVIVAFALVALVALLALVVDAGNAYVQRRHVENVMDAGAQAGALAFAQSQSSLQIWNAISGYISRNNVNPADATAWYVVQDPATKNTIVDRTKQIASYGSSHYPTTIGGKPVVGIQVEGKKDFSTYFAGVVGVKQMPASGAAACFGFQGAGSSSELFPIAISSGNFVTGTVRFEDIEPTWTYTIRLRTDDSPVFGYAGNFGWLAWNTGDSLSDANVATWMNNTETGISKTRALSDTIKGDTRVAAGSAIQAALSSRVSGAKSSVVTVPVYDQFTGSSSAGTARYRIVGFARLHIIGYVFTSTDKYITAKFQKWIDPLAEGGATYYGVSTAKCRPVITTQRALIGSLKFQKLTLAQGFTTSEVHVPVDVVNVIDTSGSMGDDWAGNQNPPPGTLTKLKSAQTALKSFNTNLRPDLGDKAALVRFPYENNGDGDYNYSCQNSGRTNNHYWGEVLRTLTSSPNITGTGSSSIRTKIDNLTARGYTPIADGLKKGRETVLGSGHSASSVAVIILASDGMTNVRANGHLTGYDGRGTAPSCNQNAEQDALDQANIAKGDTNPADYKPDTIIFTIAIGTDFNPSLLQAIATTDTDPSKPHYFRATDAASMASIYQQISQRVQQIGGETCQIIATEDFASGALVTVRYPDSTTRTVTTTSNGEFVLTGSDLVEGTYTIVSASVTVNGITYNIFTDGMGGPPLPSSPTVVVGASSGTYKIDLFLKTGSPPTCP